MDGKLVAVGWLIVMVCLAFDARADEDNVASRLQAFIGNPDPNQEDWSLHAQATEIYQGYPSFHAPYTGMNSFAPQTKWRNTTTGTLFIGRRLWEGAEAYYDPELYEGVGLNHSLGAAGFPNGEANKAGSRDIKENPARLFIRQVIGLGGPTEKIAAGQNQLAGVEDVSRITVTVGKFAASDIFDTNAYSNAPRTQFLNWAFMNSATWDYPANARGYTRGAAIELNQKGWALRYGIFIEPENQNQNDLVFHGLNNAGHVAELEERYNIGDKPGKTHFLIFYNRNREAYYDDAFALGGAINAAIDEVRGYGHGKYGFALNAEQQLTDTIGVFTRLSWNNGQTEEWMFTQVEESAAAGVSVNGKDWGRPDDTLGVAGVMNGISPGQKRAMGQGYLGLIVGDGALNYKPEMILEAYYAFRLTQYATLSPDYQFIADPGYNADRGPVNIFAGRLHVEF